MRYIIIVIGCVLLYSCSTYKRIIGKKESEQFKTTSELVGIISSDSLEGRKPGEKGMEKATAFIETYYQVLQIDPFFGDTYRDTLLVRGQESYNIVGVIESSNPSNEYILIGAHLDHLGKTESQTDSVYNGANDNASGVTAVLQVARELKKHSFSKNVIIAVFTGEESGLIGARHLARRLKKMDIPLSYMINIEMLGKPLTNSPKNVYITGYEKSDFAKVSNELLDEEFIVFEEADTRYGIFKRSDNYPFYQEYNIPAHTICTFDFENFAYYHDVRDEFSELNLQHMDKTINKISELIVLLLEHNATIQLYEQKH